jgi:hypothetical protein
LELRPLGSISPFTTAGAILSGVEEVRELNVEGMATEATRAVSVKSGRARANSLEVSGKCERRTTDKAVFDVFIRMNSRDRRCVKLLILAPWRNSETAST